MKSVAANDWWTPTTSALKIVIQRLADPRQSGPHGELLPSRRYLLLGENLSGALKHFLAAAEKPSSPLHELRNEPWAAWSSAMKGQGRAAAKAERVRDALGEF